MKQAATGEGQTDAAPVSAEGQPAAAAAAPVAEPAAERKPSRFGFGFGLAARVSSFVRSFR
jgi:hypothetical protein